MVRKSVTKKQGWVVGKAEEIAGLWQVPVYDDASPKGDKLPAQAYATTKELSTLGRLAANAEEQAKNTRFSSLADACAADAKNYRATLADIQAAILKATKGST